MADFDRKSYEAVTRRVARVRGIYSRIGEPLPAERIIQLHRVLFKTLRWTAKFGRKNGLRH